MVTEESLFVKWDGTKAGPGNYDIRFFAKADEEGNPILVGACGSGGAKYGKPGEWTSTFSRPSDFDSALFAAVMGLGLTDAYRKVLENKIPYIMSYIE